MKHEGDGYVNCNWCTWNNPQKIDNRIRRLKNQKTKRDYQDYCISKIRQNTEKNPGDLRRLALTQTTAKTLNNAGMKDSQGSEIKETESLLYAAKNNTLRTNHKKM